MVHSSIFRISILGKQLDTLASIILAVFSSEYEEFAIYRGLTCLTTLSDLMAKIPEGGRNVVESKISGQCGEDRLR